jgi:hypothetical protein
MRIAIIAATLAMALAGCTDEDIDHVARPTDWQIGAAAPSGPPVDCIDRSRIRGTSVRDDRTIDYSLDDGSLLRNRLPFACPSLSARSRFTYRTALPRLCSTDQITLADEQGQAAASCGLGRFQPIVVPPNPRPQPAAR